MNGSFIKMQRIAAGAALLAAGALWAGAASGAEGQEGGGDAAADKSLAQQIFDTMLQVPGTNTRLSRSFTRKGSYARERSRPRRMRRRSPRPLISREPRCPSPFASRTGRLTLPSRIARLAPARVEWRFASSSPTAGRPISSRCRITASSSAPVKSFSLFKRPSWRPIPASRTHGPSRRFSAHIPSP